MSLWVRAMPLIGLGGGIGEMLNFLALAQPPPGPAARAGAAGLKRAFQIVVQRKLAKAAFFLVDGVVVSVASAANADSIAVGSSELDVLVAIGAAAGASAVGCDAMPEAPVP